MLAQGHSGGQPAPANEHDRWVVESGLLPLSVEEGDFILRDTNYSSPTLEEDLERYGVSLIAPKKTSVKRERHP